MAGPSIRQRKVSTYLMLTFMVGWIVTMLGVEFYQAAIHGYGSGFGDGRHIPAQIAAQAAAKAGLPTAATAGKNVATVVALTTVKGPPGSFWQDTMRIVFSFAVLSGIMAFWYVVMSRSGTF